MFSAQIQFAFSVFVLLFMHQIVMFESAPTTADINFDIAKNRTKRAASTISESELWRDAIIAYKIKSYLEPHRCLIESAMMHMMLQSCVLFRPVQGLENEQTLFIVKSGRGQCAATMGAYNAEMVLGANRCFNFGVILHELMHVLGFHHEHQRSDRDQYLKIRSNRHQIYEKNDRSEETYFPQFDIDSITMYGPMFGAIQSKVPGQQVVSAEHKLSLSPLDVKSINELYKCHLVDNKACEKLALLDSYITNCRAQAFKYIKLSLIKPLIDQCKSSL